MTSAESWAHRPGDILNNTWEIIAPVGLGGPSEVYRAVNQTNGHEVAIKVLKAEFATNEVFQDLMRRESLQTIHHDAIVRYWGMMRRQDGGLFLVMDFIDGPSLEAAMKEDGPLSEDRLIRIARRLLGGLEAAHAKGVYHRDISPDNVILRGGEDDKATLIDFGIAKDVGSDKRTVIGKGFAGKYEYAAPEQFDGRVDARTDLYSLGMTLLAARRGRPPNLGSTHFEILKAKSQRVDLSDVAEPLRSLLERLLEPLPEDRFPSVAAALSFLEGSVPSRPATGAPAGGDRDRIAQQDITDFVQGGPPGPQPPPTAGQGQEKPRRRRWPAVAGIAAVVLLAAMGAFFLMGPGTELLGRWFGPVPDPYYANARQQGDIVVLSGYAPGEEMREALRGDLQDFAAVEGGLEISRGVPDEQWFETFRALTRAAFDLDGWTVELSGREGRVQGTAPDPATLETLQATLGELAARGPYDIELAVDLQPQPLSRSELEGIVEEFRNCGPLGVPGRGDIPPGAPIEVEGRVAMDGDVRDLRAALERVADGRAVTTDIDTLNPAICMAETLLPPTTEQSEVDIRLGYGDRPGTASGGVYYEGENPVIDLIVPGSLEDRYVYAFVVDLEGVVFHLLPHINRPENRLGEIGTVVGSRRIVRLSYPLDEAANDRVAFTVSPPFGHSMLVVVISEKQLFSQLRVGSESVEALAEDVSLALRRTDGAPFTIVRAMMELRPVRE